MLFVRVAEARLEVFDFSAGGGELFFEVFDVVLEVDDGLGEGLDIPLAMALGDHLDAELAVFFGVGHGVSQKPRARAG